MRKSVIFLSLLALLLVSVGYTQLKNPSASAKESPAFLTTDTIWANNTFRSLNEEEKIAQLFMIAAYSNKDKRYENKLLSTIKKYKPGGLIFFQGTAQRQAYLTNLLQKESKTPMFIGIDAERGLGDRLSDCMTFPRQMTLGALKDKSLIYDMGKEIGRQCKALGKHINFAPVADINSNPRNPVINTRSFGENKEDVATSCIAYMKGMQDEKIIAVAKHFPGHGDTKTDSHKVLPVINYDIKHLKENELYPFKQLINNGIQGVMTAHISLPKIDSSEKAASLSKTIVSELLKNKMGFKGLCFTDALNMRAVYKKEDNGRVIVEALIAGNDILLFPTNLNIAINAVKKAVKEKKITQKFIDDKCKKILIAKYYCGLSKRKRICIFGLNKTLNSEKAKAIKEQLIAGSISLIKNNDSLIPLKRLDTLRIASLALGASKETVFQRTLSLYTKVEHFNNKNLKNLLHNIDDYNLIIVNVYGKYSKYKDDLLRSIGKKKKIIVNFPSSPSKINPYNFNNFATASISFSKDSLYESYAAQGIFGGLAVSGTLPISIGNKFPYKHGINTDKKRLGYIKAELLGMNSKILRDSIDSLANYGITKRAYPGCQILIVKNDCVVFSKSYGHFTYDKKNPVDYDTVYDIASLTKISSTLPSIMTLFDSGKISLDKKIVNYLPQLEGTNKANIKIKDLLLHQAGLISYIYIFKNFIDKETLNGNLYSSKKRKRYNHKLAPRLYVNNEFTFKKGIFYKSKTPLYNIKINEHMYMNINYIDTIQDIIIKSRIRNKGKYMYSDLGFVFLKNIIERITNTSFDDYCNNTFYNRIGANNTCFLPLNQISAKNIAPSAYDAIFRKDTLKGMVHDPIASLLGGVSGNAGLFSNANDIAKMMYLYMNNGNYAGEHFINKETIDLFSAKNNKTNRRGLGFDKPDLKNKNVSPACYSASAESFGHSGFTGALAWCEPTNKTIFVFLSNRTFPDETNNKLIKLNIRTKIQEIIYKSSGL
jgi:beta-glucosidase-like glycosyl hydrolase/CubicO group peptidase (beta-lactamase class C family)